MASHGHMTQFFCFILFSALSQSENHLPEGRGLDSCRYRVGAPQIQQVFTVAC